MRSLRYLFYRVHQSEPKSIGAAAWIVPLFTIAAAGSLNMLCLAALMRWVMGSLPDPLDLPDLKGMLAVIAATILLILYPRWIASGRYTQFAEEFRSESSAQRRMRTILLCLYAVVTMLGPAVIGYFAGKHR